MRCVNANKHRTKTLQLRSNTALLVELNQTMLCWFVILAQLVPHDKVIPEKKMQNFLMLLLHKRSFFNLEQHRETVSLQRHVASSQTMQYKHMKK